jgi:hypothetical protein
MYLVSEEGATLAWRIGGFVVAVVDSRLFVFRASLRDRRHNLRPLYLGSASGPSPADFNTTHTQSTSTILLYIFISIAFTMGLDNLMLKIDETITGIIREWDIVSTTIAAVLISFFAYQVFTSRDPDAHPMLLARQAQASPVRQQGESAVFRSHSAPHGIPLNSGLQIKDPEDSKWARGKDGDLRDVWRRVLTGALDRDGKETGQIGTIETVLGTENIIKHDLGSYHQALNKPSH